MRTAVSGPEETSCSTGATPPVLTPAVLPAPAMSKSPPAGRLAGSLPAIHCPVIVALDDG
eukprot:7309998-Alexandrium_andersonii.AAC.1